MIYINYVNNALIHENPFDASLFTLSVPYMNSKDGFMKVMISRDMIYPCRLRDGTVKDNYSNIRLGEADETRRVFIEDDDCNMLRVTNSEILEAFELDRRSYKAARLMENMLNAQA